MKKEVLEVLLVDGEGFNHFSFLDLLGGSSYYVILQIGNEIFRSKSSSGNSKKVAWNEKFIFEVPHHWRTAQLHLKVMKLRTLVEDEFVGEAKIYLEGISMQGHENGYKALMPSPYNIVTKDGHYDGEIKVGVKFTRIEALEVLSEGEKN